MTNWMRDLKRVYGECSSPTFVATAGNYIHMVVPGIPNEGAVLKRCRIIGSGVTTTGTNYLDIKIINDAGAYKAAEAASAGSGEPYIVFAWNDQTSTAGPNSLWVSDVTFSDDVIYEDGLDATNMYIRIEAPNGLTGDATFSARVWADGLIRTETPPDTNLDKNLAIRRWSTGNVWKDMRDVRGPEHRLNASSLYPANTLFSATSDYIYFGLEDSFTGLWFYLSSANSTVGRTTLWEYYNGTTWSTLTVRDNCVASNAVSDIIFAYSGIIEWDAPSDWAKTDLSSLSAPYDGNETPTRYGPYGTFPTADNDGARTSRYWVRLSLDNIAGQATFKWVKVKPQI